MTDVGYQVLNQQGLIYELKNETQVVRFGLFFDAFLKNRIQIFRSSQAKKPTKIRNLIAKPIEK